MVPKIVQFLKRKDFPLNTIKVKCKDAEGYEFIDYLPIVRVSNCKKFLLSFWDEANLLK